MNGCASEFGDPVNARAEFLSGGEHFGPRLGPGTWKGLSKHLLSEK